MSSSEIGRKARQPTSNHLAYDVARGSTIDAASRGAQRVGGGNEREQGK